jgi:hypothetical protein
MKTTAPKTPTGEIDSARLDLFGVYLAVRAKTDLILLGGT